MEAIEIRERAEDTMNGNERAFMLPHIWDALLQRPSDSEGWGQPDPAYIEQLIKTRQQHQMTLLKRTTVLSKTSTLCLIKKLFNHEYTVYVCLQVVTPFLLLISCNLLLQTGVSS